MTDDMSLVIVAAVCVSGFGKCFREALSSSACTGTLVEFETNLCEWVRVALGAGDSRAGRGGSDGVE